MLISAAALNRAVPKGLLAAPPNGLPKRKYPEAQQLKQKT